MADKKKELEELNSLLKFWKEILCLSDWNIQVQVLSAAKMALKQAEAKGHITWITEERSAMISILTKKEIEKIKKKLGGLQKEENQEAILIHELLHLLTDNVSPGNESEELLINTITKSLLKLKGNQTSVSH